jgi:hypothetical protein
MVWISGAWMTDAVSSILGEESREPSRLLGVIPPGSSRDMPQSPSAWPRTNWPLLPVSSPDPIWVAGCAELTLPRGNGELSR